MSGPIELVGFSRFGIPTNREDGEEIGTEFAYDLSALLHVTRRVQALLEQNGHAGLSGDEAGEGRAFLSPGVKIAPLDTQSLFVGVGVSVPLQHDEVDARLRTSIFYHF